MFQDKGEIQCSAWTGVAMSGKVQILKVVRAAFEREARINLHKYPIRMDFSDGVLTLEGEAERSMWRRRNCLWNSRLLFPESQASWIDFT